MAQSGFTPIQLYASTTGGNVPTTGNLSNSASGAELAINITDGKLFYKDNAGVVQVIATKASVSSGVIGPASATDTAIATFDGVTGKLIKNNSGVTIASNIITALGFLGPHNGTVGAITPAAGAFTTLSTTGAITVNGSAGANGQALFSAGSGISPTWGSTFVVDATDIGYAANQIPLNQYLGRLAYQDALSASDDGANVFVGVSDVGYNANQVPLNQYLGSLAYQSAKNAAIESLTITQPISTPSLAPTIASATTIAPVNYITLISGTAAIVNITPTAVMANGGGALILIPTGAFTTTTAGNIALASTATVGRAMTMVYDSNTTKWYPSY